METLTLTSSANDKMESDSGVDVDEAPVDDWDSTEIACAKATPASIMSKPSTHSSSPLAQPITSTNSLHSIVSEAKAAVVQD